MFRSISLRLSLSYQLCFSFCTFNPFIVFPFTGFSILDKFFSKNWIMALHYLGQYYGQIRGQGRAINPSKMAY